MNTQVKGKRKGGERGYASWDCSVEGEVVGWGKGVGVGVVVTDARLVGPGPYRRRRDEDSLWFYLFPRLPGVSIDILQLNIQSLQNKITSLYL